LAVAVPRTPSALRTVTAALGGSVATRIVRAQAGQHLQPRAGVALLDRVVGVDHEPLEVGDRVLVADRALVGLGDVLQQGRLGDQAVGRDQLDDRAVVVALHVQHDAAVVVLGEALGPRRVGHGRARRAVVDGQGQPTRAEEAVVIGRGRRRRGDHRRGAQPEHLGSPHHLLSGLPPSSPPAVSSMPEPEPAPTLPEPEPEPAPTLPEPGPGRGGRRRGWPCLSFLSLHMTGVLDAIGGRAHLALAPQSPCSRQ
jgi:hypothetical protein